MNKYVLMILFVLISLLAIGTVSAVDDYNVSDDSILSEQIYCDDIQSSVDELNISKEDSTVDDVVSMGEEQSNGSDDILSEDNCDQISIIDENEADQSVSYNSSGEVIGLSINENNADLIGNDNSDSSDIFLNIIKFINEVNPDFISQASRFIISHPDILEITIKFISEPVNENASFIEGINEIIDGIDINYTNVFNKFIDGLFPDFNGTKIVNELVDLFKFNMSDESLFNFSSFEDLDFDELYSSFTINSTSISKSIGEIFSGITLNLTDLNSFGLNASYILNKFFDAIGNYNFTDEMNEIVNQILNNTSFNLENITKFFDEFGQQNNLTFNDILNIVGNFTDGLNFNLSSIFNLFDLNNILSHTNINAGKIFSGIVGIIKSFDLNESKLIDFLSEFFDATVEFIINSIGDLNKIINATKVYISNIVDGLINISKQIKFNFSSIDNLGNIIYDSSSFNTSKIAGGLAMVRDALNRDVPKIVDSINSFINKVNSTISIISSYINKIVDFISDFFNPSKGGTPENGTQPSKPSALVKPASVTKVVAKNKAFKKSKKNKKFTVTLKSGNAPVKNVILSLKFKGKTYTAKTNANGKATFKLKISKKSKAKGVIKFKGNSLYKASSKKVKITIK